MHARVVLVAAVSTAMVVVVNRHVTADTDAKLDSVNVLGAAIIEVPAQFKRVKPKSSMVQHEFQAKAGEGEQEKTARVTMMAAGGDVAANIRRWKGQFAGGNKGANKVDQFTLGEWGVHIVDVNGAYAERSGGPFAGGKVVNHENYGMTGAILVHPDGRKFFVKMIGPDEVIKANRDAFVAMIKSLDR